MITFASSPDAKAALEATLAIDFQKSKAFSDFQARCARLGLSSEEVSGMLVAQGAVTIAA